MRKKLRADAKRAQKMSQGLDAKEDDESDDTEEEKEDAKDEKVTWLPVKYLPENHADFQDNEEFDGKHP